MHWEHSRIEGGGWKWRLVGDNGGRVAVMVQLPGDAPGTRTMARIYWIDGSMTDHASFDAARDVLAEAYGNVPPLGDAAWPYPTYEQDREQYGPVENLS